jgi:hypothetical protein
MEHLQMAEIAQKFNQGATTIKIWNKQLAYDMKKWFENHGHKLSVTKDSDGYVLAFK